MNEQDILRQELDKLKADVITRHEQSGQVASGKTKQSFEVATQPFAGQLMGASYVGVLERGRKPGKVPYDFVDILKRWASAKGISFSDEKQFNRWANGVKWKIIREGTKLYRSGTTQDIFDTPIKEFDIRLTERISIYYQQKVTNEIFNF